MHTLEINQRAIRFCLSTGGYREKVIPTYLQVHCLWLTYLLRSAINHITQETLFLDPFQLTFIT